MRVKDTLISFTVATAVSEHTCRAGKEGTVGGTHPCGITGRASADSSSGRISPTSI